MIRTGKEYLESIRTRIYDISENIINRTNWVLKQAPDMLLHVIRKTAATYANWKTPCVFVKKAARP